MSSSCSQQHSKLRIQLEATLILLETCNKVGAQVSTETPWRERRGDDQGGGLREGTPPSARFWEERGLWVRV